MTAALRDQRYSEDAWDDAILCERSPAHVAATRAWDQLSVTGNGRPSSLMGVSAAIGRGSEDR